MSHNWLSWAGGGEVLTYRPPPGTLSSPRKEPGRPMSLKWPVKYACRAGVHAIRAPV